MLDKNNKIKYFIELFNYFFCFVVMEDLKSKDIYLLVEFNV